MDDGYDSDPTFRIGPGSALPGTYSFRVVGAGRAVISLGGCQEKPIQCPFERAYAPLERFSGVGGPPMAHKPNSIPPFK
uniref:Uncharacterized protein n=1 Tax=Picea glauca TaxID=3330 RepID=A0A101LWX7_PICGL|nr:hypothetical protein ABT39_MTgene6342 [Picea glauca]